MKIKYAVKGFTLIEMLLVMVIIGIILYASINYVQQRAQQQRIDRASAQVQQILNAGLSYYIANGDWPADLNTLKTQGYLPGSLTTNPWGQEYALAKGAPLPPGSTFANPPPLLYVWSATTQATPEEGTPTGSAAANANAIAGNLPLGYTTSVTGTPPPGPGASGYAECATESDTCYFVGMVNVPGQNLNNARALNFAGLYHHGACVPVPQCPVDVTGATMTPEIIVVPVSVSGLYKEGAPNVYPISSFTAYASGDPQKTPPGCKSGTRQAQAVACTPISGASADSYWRVCMQIVTELGDTAVSNPQTGSDAWGQYVTVAAFTRCGVTGEPAGSTLQVFSN